MQFATVPETSIGISRVGLGSWAIGSWMWGGTDDAESIANPVGPEFMAPPPRPQAEALHAAE
jgi:hypothetical protein